jgi:hypothetical protein
MCHLPCNIEIDHIHKYNMNICIATSPTQIEHNSTHLKVYILQYATWGIRNQKYEYASCACAPNQGTGRSSTEGYTHGLRSRINIFTIHMLYMSYMFLQLNGTNIIVSSLNDLGESR